MNIIRLIGGLGNQMYDYALYVAMREKGRQVKLHEFVADAVDTWNTTITRGSLLGCFPSVKFEFASEQEVQKMCGDNSNIISRALRHFNLPFGYKEKLYRETNPAEINLQILDMDNIYFDGYWQHAGYFENVTDKLKDDFVFQKSTKPEDVRALEQIQGSNSVGVHVRRGDYLKTPDLYGGICTEAYYKEAFEIMRGMVSDPHFFFFTDDPHWVKKQFKLKNMLIVDWNDSTAESWRDMRLMSFCQHNIIANSSFSWWAAWLNDNQNKSVISPARWEYGKPMAAYRRMKNWIYLE